MLNRANRDMDQEKKDQWIQLCELASTEQDPDKLLRLVVEINRLLDEKSQNLKTVNDGSREQSNLQSN